METTTQDHGVMLERLHLARAHGQMLDNEDVEYWADRFAWLRIRPLTGITFERYLGMPEYWDDIAQARRQLARQRRRRRVIVLPGEGPCRTTYVTES